MFIMLVKEKIGYLHYLIVITIANLKNFVCKLTKPNLTYKVSYKNRCIVSGRVMNSITLLKFTTYYDSSKFSRFIECNGTQEK